MFARIKELLHTEKELSRAIIGEGADPQLQAAVVALLLLMAGSDGEIVEEEIETIFASIKRQFKLSDEQARDLLQRSDAQCLGADEIDEFVQLINTQMNDEQRVQVMSLVWKVVLADEQVRAEECGFMKDLQDFLHLSDEQVERAKAIAKEEDS